MPVYVFIPSASLFTRGMWWGSSPLSVGGKLTVWSSTCALIAYSAPAYRLGRMSAVPMMVVLRTLSTSPLQFSTFSGIASALLMPRIRLLLRKSARPTNLAPVAFSSRSLVSARLSGLMLCPSAGCYTFVFTLAGGGTATWGGFLVQVSLGDWWLWC